MEIPAARGGTYSVRDVDEIETVTLSTTSPQVGTAVTASISGGDTISGTTTWSWKNSSSSAVIGTGSSYTPASSDAGKTLTATATYTDPFGSGKTASKSTGTVPDNPNRPPTIGSILARSSIDENTPSGDARAVTLITDPDGDTVTVSLSSTHFSLNRGISSGNYYYWGATTNSNTIDYESTTTVSGTFTATDAHGASASRSFSFTVNDLDEGETLSLTTTSPRVGNPITARLSGGDDIEAGPTWAWTRSGSSSVIGTSSSYTPTASDVGKTLTVTATYTDTHSAKTLSRTTGTVRPTQNQAPTITSTLPNETIDENKRSISHTVYTNDPDGDQVTLSISDPHNKAFFSPVETNVILIRETDHESIPSFTTTVTATGHQRSIRYQILHRNRKRRSTKMSGLTYLPTAQR